jgi:hypothetical protein
LDDYLSVPLYNELMEVLSSGYGEALLKGLDLCSVIGVKANEI